MFSFCCCIRKFTYRETNASSLRPDNGNIALGNKKTLDKNAKYFNQYPVSNIGTLILQDINSNKIDNREF